MQDKTPPRTCFDIYPLARKHCKAKLLQRSLSSFTFEKLANN